MKKQILFAVAFATTIFSANAQFDGNFETLFGVPDATVTITREGELKNGVRFFADTRTVDGEVIKENQTMKYEKNTKTFTNADGSNKVKYNTRLSFNGKAIGIDEEGAMPKTRIIQFKPTSAGTLTVATQGTAGRNMIVSKYNNGTLTQLGKLDVGATTVGSGSGNDATPWFHGVVEYGTYTAGDEIWIYADQNIYFWGFNFSGSTDAAYEGTFPSDGGDPTSIANDQAAKTIISTEYFNVAGIQSEVLQKGLNIVKNTYEDGSVKVTKAYIK